MLDRMDRYRYNYRYIFAISNLTHLTFVRLNSVHALAHDADTYQSHCATSELVHWARYFLSMARKLR